MRVFVTGAQGFIGKNFVVHLQEMDWLVLPFGREDDKSELPKLVEQADAIVHLAGENRSKNVDDFAKVNAGLTQDLCDVVKACGRKIPFILASSIQVDHNNPYGLSKLAAEKKVQQLSKEADIPSYIYRLPNVFGKWCKPNYNSVVATFCHNIVRGLPIQINDESAQLSLVYIDDLMAEFVRVLRDEHRSISRFVQVIPEYQITLGELADKIRAFKNSRENLMSEAVGTGLTRALYSTYISYLDASQFSYLIPAYRDDRGIFIEMLKTQTNGQFSFFTANQGVTRGGHYHHTKTEKFLVIKGKARFRFRHLITGEFYEIYTSGRVSEIVEIVPGWAHDVTNVGDEELICMLWANEIFDSEKPDTFAFPVNSDV